jgi:hypothetical protein
MKWAVFLIGVAGILPLIQLLKRRPLEQQWAWVLFGFFPFLLSAVPNLNLSAIAWPAWPGHVKGLQITAFDLYAIAMYFALPRRPYKIRFKLGMIFYFMTVILSIFVAQVPFASIFYAWQLIRVFFVYVIILKSGSDERVTAWILKGLAGGLFLEACFAVWERFGEGIIQASGSLGHQNFLGLISHFVVFPFFALLLAGRRGWLPLATTLAGLVIWILTASRATLGLGGGGLVLLLMASSYRKWTSRKARIFAFGVVAAIIFVPLALGSLDSRFAASPLSKTYDERIVLENIAAAIASDNPMGVGANNFTVVANTRGYSDRAGLAATYGSRSAIVHNIYWLSAAEEGYLGVIGLIAFLLQPLIVALRCGFRRDSDYRRDLMLGLGVAVAIVYVHSNFEWIFVSLESQYIYAIILGLIAVGAERLGYWRNTGGSQLVGRPAHYRPLVESKHRFPAERV